MKPENKTILTDTDIRRAIVRLAHEILEKNQRTEALALVGIRTRGVHLADRLQKEIEAIKKVKLSLGTLDITLYRDDIGEVSVQPNVKETNIPFDLNGKTVILVDDVLYTGRTIRAALDALIDFGRPEAIQLAVLVDRGHREFPIRADYVGKNIPTSKKERVILKMKESDGCDTVTLEAAL